MHVRTFFECPAAAAQPSAQRAATDVEGALGLQPGNHLVERDVLGCLDHGDDKGFMSIEPRAARLALPPCRALTILTGAPDPDDCRRHADPEPGRRPTGGRAARGCP